MAINKKGFRVGIRAAAVLALCVVGYYIGRPVYWKITASMQELHEKNYHPDAVKKVAQDLIGWQTTPVDPKPLEEEKAEINPEVQELAKEIKEEQDKDSAKEEGESKDKVEAKVEEEKAGEVPEKDTVEENVKKEESKEESSVESEKAEEAKTQ